MQKINQILNSGWNGFKYAVKQVWHFIEIEIPELMSNWRLVPRLMMVDNEHLWKSLLGSWH